jgi:hypothetical protein
MYPSAYTLLKADPNASSTGAGHTLSEGIMIIFSAWRLSSFLNSRCTTGSTEARLLPNVSAE